MQINSPAKAFWTPVKEIGLIEMHRQLNAHVLQFGNGKEIDLSQSPMIMQAKPISFGQKTQPVLPVASKQSNEPTRVNPGT